MNRPKESEYASHVAYSRDLETYADALEAALREAKELFELISCGTTNIPRENAYKAIVTINEVWGDDE